MNDENVKQHALINTSNEAVAKQSIPVRLYLMVSVIGAIIVAIMLYGFSASNYMLEKYTPLIDATMQIKLKTTTAHLWFEEILSGDRYEEMSSVRESLTQSQWYVAAMLEGGEDIEGKYIALTDPVLRAEIEKVSEKISTFKKVTEQRYAQKNDSAAGSVIDQKYDNIFLDFIQQVDKVKIKLQQHIKQESYTVKIIQQLLLVISVISIVLIVWLFHRFERRQANAYQEIFEAKEELSAALEEIKTLQGIIPICSYCKNIRDDKGLWNQLEAYIHNHSDAQFSHGVCPDCYEKQMQGLKNT